METFTAITLLCLIFVGSVHPHPADHREDTVLPFSLSPGNVNLETYYLDKYPKPGPGGPLQKPTGSPTDDNVFADNDELQDAHAIFRTRRAAKPQYYHQGYMDSSRGHVHDHQVPRAGHGYEHHRHFESYNPTHHHQHHRNTFNHHQSHHGNNLNHFHG